MIKARDENSDYDLNYFNNEHTNLKTPADSMNNMTVGAAADGLYDGVFNGIASGKEFPVLSILEQTILTLRPFYILIQSRIKIYLNQIFLKAGGDYGFYSPTAIDMLYECAISVLSSNPAFGYTKEVGTSLAAPFAANLSS